MVNHLPASIKHLLALRNLHPWPSPSPSKLEGLFSQTLRDAKFRNAETGWLILTTCTLLGANRPSSLGHLYRFVTKTNETGSRGNVASAANKAALMRESALKSAIFVILSLAALHEALEDDVRQTLRTKSRRTITVESINATVLRGKSLWNSIYTPHADKLLDKLGSYHPDFISFIIQSYGSVLAPLPGGTRSYSHTTSIDDPDQGNLSQALGSVVGIASLRAEGRVGPQLVSHVFGLLKARYLKGQTEEDAWLSSDDGTEWVIRTVDQILDVLSETEEAEVKPKL